MLPRTLAGLCLASIVALAARRAGSLAPSGTVAAVVIGSVSISAGWDWGALLIAFFIASSALTRWREATKEVRVGAIVEKGGERDAWQVLANGACFAGAALASFASASPLCFAVGAGALAASTADTWATEIGSLFGGAPRSLMTGKVVAAGTSGGVSVAGTLASLAGATFIAGLAHVAGWPRVAEMSAVVGGIGGSLADTILGATLQERRHCATCGLATERLVHPCGTPTAMIGGLPGFRNDAVNFAASAIGGALGAAVATASR